MPGPGQGPAPLSFMQQPAGWQTHVGLRFRQPGVRGDDRPVFGRQWVLRRMFSRQLRRMRALMPQPLKIGTRGSKLALWQANWVKTTLQTLFPVQPVELVVIKTRGDKILDVPLAKVGGKGLFVKELEEAIADGRADMAVHSMKDMPAVIPPGLTIGAVPERESPQDVLISRDRLTLSQLPSGARIGTSSLRRAAQLRRLRPDLQILPLRGNLDTRLKKLFSQGLDALVLAAAGVKRLGLDAKITEYLDTTVMLPSVGQGALCIETRIDDPRVGPLVGRLDHPATRTVVSGERAFLKRLEGGCQVPIAGLGRLEGARFVLDGLVAAVDGSKVFRDSLAGPHTDAARVGVRLAERLLDRGAGHLLAALKAEDDGN